MNETKYLLDKYVDRPNKYTYKMYLNDIKSSKTDMMIAGIATFGFSYFVSYVYGYKYQKKLYENDYKRSRHYKTLIKKIITKYL